MVLYGRRHILKMDKVHFYLSNIGKIVLQGLVTEGASYALIPHPDRIGLLVFFLNIGRQNINLHITAGLHDFFHDTLHMRRVRRILQLSHRFGNDLVFPFPVQHLHVSGILIGRYLPYHIHPLFQSLYQDRIQPVYFLTQFC